LALCLGPTPFVGPTTFLGPTKEWVKNKNKEIKTKKSIQNKIQDFKNTFFPKTKIPRKPTCKVECV
jgi:hypothetical protein